MGDQYAFSAHAETGGTATVVNHVFIQGLERRWTRPAPPSLDRDAVPRPVEMAKVKAELAGRGGVAITGKAAGLAVQGAPGVGKTTLARLLAVELNADSDYPGRRDLGGPGPRFHLGGAGPGGTAALGGLRHQLLRSGREPQQALHLRAGRGARASLPSTLKLLVVLDNVWSLAAIRPLRDALPPGCRLIVTTRSRAIAQGLGAGWVEVGLLSEAEALDLFDLRLGCAAAA